MTEYKTIRGRIKANLKPLAVAGAIAVLGFSSGCKTLDNLFPRYDTNSSVFVENGSWGPRLYPYRLHDKTAYEIISADSIETITPSETSVIRHKGFK